MSDDWGNDPIQKVAAPNAPVAAPQEGDWGNDPVVGAKNFKFSDAAIKSAVNRPGTTTVYMKPDTYLALTPDLPANPQADRKGASLKKSLDKGDEVDEVPSLQVTVGKDGAAKVTDQDGRHRAQFAKDNGLTMIPVMVQRDAKGERVPIANLVGMKDGSDPVPFNFAEVIPPRPQKPESAASKGLPRWDVLGDIGRSAEAAGSALKRDVKGAFPSMADRQAQDAANRAKYGPVLGTIKSATVDQAAGGLSALKIPVDALGVAASPVTGTLHALGGSAIAAGLEHMPIPGHDPKADADQLIDTAMIGLGPETMGADAAGVAAAASRGNALAKATNLNPGVEEAHAAGYTIPPVMAKKSTNLLEKFGSADAGKVKIQQAASVKNQAVTDKIAAKELGLPEDTTLTDKVFKDVRKDAGKDYSAVANSVPIMQANDKYRSAVSNLGGRSQEASAQFPGVTENPELDALEKNLGKVEKFTPDAALFVVRKLRKDAAVNLKNTQDVNKGALGLAQKKAADSIDDLIEDNLVAAGKQDLIPKYKSARQLIAKSYDLEGATNTATGNVSAVALARLANRGRPLTGGLRTIANAANSFRKAFQNPEAFGGVEPYSVLDLGAAGASALAHRWDILGGVLARPVVRNALLSKGYQDSMIPNLGAVSATGPSPGLALLKNTPLPGIQNQLAKGVYRAAHTAGVNAVKANALRQMLSGSPPPNTPPQGQ